MSNSEFLYLITTRRANSTILNNASSEIDLFTNETFWKFFISDDGPLNDIISMVDEWKKSKDDSYNDLSDTLDSIQKGTFNGNRKRLKNAIVACALDTHYGKPQYDGEIEAREAYIENVTALFSTIRKLGDTQVYITHNWYNKPPLYFSSGSKHVFLEMLIKIITSHHKDTQVKLFAHDKDIFDRSVKDSVVTTDLLSADYSNMKEHANLYKIIDKKHAYAFQHDKSSMFLKHVLNKKSIEGLERRLDNFLRISDEFARVNIINLSPDADTSEKKEVIHIHLNFTSEFEYQFPSVFSQLVDFNHHAWKQQIRFIPKLLNNIKRTKIDIKQFTSLPILITSDRPLVDSNNGKKALIELDARARYMDSSIWMRFMQFANAADISTNLESIRKLFPHDFFVYQTANAKEIREFNARLCINSRLQDLYSGHGKHVTPFPFSSESDNYKIVRKQLYKLQNRFKVKSLSMRLLLIDDKSDNSNSRHYISKLEILKSVFSNNERYPQPNDKLFNGSILEGKAHIHVYHKRHDINLNLSIDYACSIREAELLLEKRKYDIILLDYLFEYEGTQKRIEYGTQLLKDIIVQSERESKNEPKIAKWYKNRGPIKKFWIYFISAFSTAIREDLRVSNMHYSEKYWHIARGACASNTPGLFLANFYNLLNRQIEELTDIGNSAKIFKKGTWIVTVIDFLHALFSEKSNVKLRAIRTFNSFLQLRSHYESLYQDYYFENNILEESKECGSLLVQSLFPDIQYYGLTFWGHLQHLIYLIAFGNTGQWEILWSEYQCIENELIKAENFQEQSDTEKKPINKKIEKYIFYLRKLNQNH